VRQLSRADLIRLESICARLDPADAQWLAEQLEPAWRRRERRLAARDTAIRDAASLYAAAPSGRALATHLRNEMLKPRRVPKLQEIVDLYEGRVPSVTRLRAALAGIGPAGPNSRLVSGHRRSDDAADVKSKEAGHGQSG
jgi:hypothetical protein